MELLIFLLVAIFGIMTGCVVDKTLTLIGRLFSKSLLDVFGKIWEAFYMVIIILIIILCLWSCIGNEQSPSYRDEFDDRQGPFYRGDEF